MSAEKTSQSANFSRFYEKRAFGVDLVCANILVLHHFNRHTNNQVKLGNMYNKT
jgi:hypothetical protein